MNGIDWRGVLPPDAPESRGAGILEQLHLSPGRLRSHRPKQIVASVLLFRATLEPRLPEDEAAFAWEALTTGPVERVALPCRHADMDKPAHAARIAAALHPYLL